MIEARSTALPPRTDFHALRRFQKLCILSGNIIVSSNKPPLELVANPCNRSATTFLTTGVAAKPGCHKRNIGRTNCTCYSQNMQMHDHAPVLLNLVALKQLDPISKGYSGIVVQHYPIFYTIV